MDKELAADLREQLFEALVARRRELGMSQLEVAKAMGTTQSHISMMEGGGRDVTVGTVFLYLRAVKLKMQLAFDYED